MILIGSRALLLRNSSLLLRKPSDFDFVCTMPEFEIWLDTNKEKVKPKKVYSENDGNKIIIEGGSNCEFEIIQPGKSSELLAELVKSDADAFSTSFGLVPSIDMLFTIKSSHKYLKNSPHFWKTLLDYHTLKSAGAKVRPEYMTFLKMREKETYTYNHPKLNQTKKDFFSDDGLIYEFDHDTIHQSVALYEKPAYINYMKDGSEVQCDKAKFFACSRNIQLAGAAEEGFVLALERSLIPHPGVWEPKFAWKFALSKVMSSITSGWFREFTYENAFDVLKLYQPNFWNKFQADVKSGLVRKFVQPNM